MTGGKRKREGGREEGGNPGTSFEIYLTHDIILTSLTYDSKN